MTTTVGILAHVDAGKTTLCEQLLFRAGVLRKPGRVDDGNTLLDRDPVERRRGITVFSGQACFSIEGSPFTLIDTPGHVDFLAETVRCLPVLDIAVLLIDGGSGLQGHTRTIFSLTENEKIPTVFFLNKSDLISFDRARAMNDITASLSPCLVPVSENGVDCEALASLDDAFCERYLEDRVTEQDIWNTLCNLTLKRKAFPVLTGAALSGLGTDILEQLLLHLGNCLSDRWHTLEMRSPAGKVYQIRIEPDGTRVSFLRVLQGIFTPRLSFPSGDSLMKIHQLRLYRGNDYTCVSQALPGDIIGVTGLSGVNSGDSVSVDGVLFSPDIQSRAVLQSAVEAIDGTSPESLLIHLKTLAEEEPSLAVEWDSVHRQPLVRVMGTVQTEVLAQLLQDRFSLSVRFLPPKVLFRETVCGSSIGCGHYEPLRHYAEVRLRLMEAPRGSGISFESRCHEDTLSLNWQRLIRTHVFEKQHKGVLIGAPLTDVRVVLLAGRDHLKHTEGGDFREAVYRAIRHALMKADSRLLEPFYRYSVAVPLSMRGKVITELTSLGASWDASDIAGETAVINGRCPVRTMMDWPIMLRTMTHGKGDIQLEPDGYDFCSDSERIITEADYSPEADRDNQAGSVFCSHGAGYYVPWQDAESLMHIHPKDVSETADPRPL